MLKYKCSNNANHIFEKPTEDFWCSLCDISTKPMLIPFEEENVIDIHPTTNEQKEDINKTVIKLVTDNVETKVIDQSLSTPSISEDTLIDKIVEEPKMEPKQEPIIVEPIIQDVQDELIEKKVTYEEISFGNQIWMKNFYSNTEFSNGDKITYAKNEKEWKKLNDKKIPAWTFASDSESSEKYGILYNFYAINNIAGIAPTGWRIPSIEDVKQLKNNLEITFVSEHIKRFNQSKVYHSLALGTKIEAEKYRIFWTSNEKFYTAFAFEINEDNPSIEMKKFDKSAGFFVRCLKIKENELI
jgi:uncharacterized protein (TIGR02145 family)